VLCTGTVCKSSGYRKVFGVPVHSANTFRFNDVALYWAHDWDGSGLKIWIMV
jgi:hypothetical protein